MSRSLIESNTFGETTESGMGIDIGVVDELMLENAAIVSGTESAGDAGDILINASKVVLSELEAIITEIELLLDITHTWDEDIITYLTNPDGNEITLFSFVGSDGDNFTNTILSDTADTYIYDGFAPFTGVYLPEEPLGSLAKGELNGEWTLTLEDTFPSEDDGSLNNWSIKFNGEQTFTNNIPQAFGGENSSLPSSIDSVIETRDIVPSVFIPAGVAGTIDIHATDSVSLTGNSSITTEAVDANGGSVTIDTGRIVTLEDSKITTSAQSADENFPDARGNGGGIFIYTVDSFEMRNSRLLAEAFNEGGDIFVDPYLILIDRSELNASAGKKGGNITLVSDMFLRSYDSPIKATGGIEVGVVDIQSPNVIEDGNLLTLPESLLDADSHLPERCAVKLDGNYSSLIVVGRGGVPIAPGGYLPAYQLSGGDWDEENEN